MPGHLTYSHIVNRKIYKRARIQEPIMENHWLSSYYLPLKSKYQSDIGSRVCIQCSALWLEYKWQFSRYIFLLRPLASKSFSCWKLQSLENWSKKVNQLEDNSIYSPSFPFHWQLAKYFRLETSQQQLHEQSMKFLEKFTAFDTNQLQQKKSPTQCWLLRIFV